MTTREEYAEAAKWFEYMASISGDREAVPERSDKLAARVLLALADGAVLCEAIDDGMDMFTIYKPLEPPI